MFRATSFPLKQSNKINNKYDYPLSKNTLSLYLIPFFFFFIFGRPEAYRAPGPDPSHSHNLSRSCGNPGSPTHGAVPGIEPMSQSSQDTANSISPQWEHVYLILVTRIFSTKGELCAFGQISLSTLCPHSSSFPLSPPILPSFGTWRDKAAKLLLQTPVPFDKKGNT